MTATTETGGAAVAQEAPVRCPCGRLLCDPVSRARGLGPVCYRRLYGRTADRGHESRVRHLGPTSGQLALDLEDHWDDEDDPEWDEDEDDYVPRGRDLWGQGLTAHQLHTMTDIPLTGSYL